MLTLTLNPEEQETLVEVIQSAILDIHSEIVHCDNFQYKTALKSRKHVLQNMLDVLAAVTAPA